LTTIKSTIRNNYDRKEPTNDYLKYWRVIRYWVKAKYGLTTPDLEMLLFLYSEQLFNKTDFKEYEELMSWDVNRFDRMLRDGWIHVWRKRKGNQATLYELTYKTRRIIDTIYKKLNGEEISERNPLFNKNVSYTDKVYRNAIKKINESTKQLQHHAPE
tara:strand:+ start:1744 stop:2217 length:474 start_codon:yes stop_codon:yes gene_type:complete